MRSTRHTCLPSATWHTTLPRRPPCSRPCSQPCSQLMSTRYGCGYCAVASLIPNAAYAHFATILILTRDHQVRTDYTGLPSMPSAKRRMTSQEMVHMSHPASECLCVDFTAHAASASASAISVSCSNRKQRVSRVLSARSRSGSPAPVWCLPQSDQLSHFLPSSSGNRSLAQLTPHRRFAIPHCFVMVFVCG